MKTKPDGYHLSFFVWTMDDLSVDKQYCYWIPFDPYMYPKHICADVADLLFLLISAWVVVVLILLPGMCMGVKQVV